MLSCRPGDLVFDTTLSVCLSVCVCARVQIAAATLSGNSLRQTVRIHCASVHQAEKLVAALLRFTGVIAGLAESNGQPTTGFMAHVACRHDCQEPGSAPEPYAR